jgi:hypothetical protein
MKFCQQCGTELPANAGFCPQCGYRVAPAPAEEEPLQFPASEEHKGPSEPILPESPSPESKEPDLVGGPPPPLQYAAPPEHRLRRRPPIMERLKRPIRLSLIPPMLMEYPLQRRSARAAGTSRSSSLLSFWDCWQLPGLFSVIRSGTCLFLRKRGGLKLIKLPS